MAYIKKRITPTDWEKILKDLPNDYSIIGRFNQAGDWYKFNKGKLDWAIDDTNNSYLLRMPDGIQDPYYWYLFYFNNTAICFGLDRVKIRRDPYFCEIEVVLKGRNKIEDPDIKKAMQLAINVYAYKSYDIIPTLQLLF